MKKALSSFDVLALVREMQELVDGFFVKAYRTGRDRVLLRFNRLRRDQEPGDGRFQTVEFRIDSGRAIYPLEEPEDKPPEPGTFARTLRKHLGNARVSAVRQHRFDRVIAIDMEKKGNFTLVVELFREGNMILTEEGNILATLFTREWSDRKLRIGAQYSYPPEGPDPREFDPEGFNEALSGGKGDIVRSLVSRVGLPPQYAEEACLQLGIEKGAEPGSLDDGTMMALFEFVGGLFTRVRDDPRPVIIVKDEDTADAAPLALSIFEDLEIRPMPSMGQALEAHFSKVELLADAPEKMTEVARLERQLEKQQHAEKEYAETAEAFKQTGDLVFTNYQFVNDIIEKTREAVERLGWEEVMARIEGNDTILEADPARKEITVRLPDDVELDLDIYRDVEANAARVYDRGKKIRDKLPGLRAAMENTRRDIKRAKKRGTDRPEKRRRSRKRFWFESFRWFLSTNGTLVVGGKDAPTNDRVVKKYLRDGDRYVHADVHGAPSVVVRRRDGDDTVDEDTLAEAARFALATSRLWNAKVGSGSAYWVKPEQVSKTPEAGESLARGAFIIRGKKNLHDNLPMEFGVGVVEVEGAEKVMGGPPSAVKAHCGSYVILVPGEEAKQTLAKRLAREWDFTVDEVEPALPPGPSTVVEDRRAVERPENGDGVE